MFLLLLLVPLLLVLVMLLLMLPAFLCMPWTLRSSLVVVFGGTGSPVSFVVLVAVAVAVSCGGYRRASGPLALSLKMSLLTVAVCQLRKL